MRILAIDTATEACSAALDIDGDSRERFKIAPRQHTELILPMVESLLDEAGLTLSQLDLIAFGRGPGAFTGVRIASAVTQGLAFSSDLPVAPVSTLAALAWSSWRERGETETLSAIDARMAEVYWGCYRVEKGSLVAVQDECVCAPEEIPMPPDGHWFGCGTGWYTYGARLHRHLDRPLAGWVGECLPQARDIAALGAQLYVQGKTVSPEQALPVYLRDQVATPSLKVKRPTGVAL
ncbi:MAG: tRNA (adenosine(37)-N6)-threonylcarbamoyltransferase complex dimerization subunit type 1 TsaB [Gammaproteobacteria bacterium]|nr:tRNA (adenosine(37)-N6)-threonylcarbamoyltransferase complex dimerization subunit type 1 TsaB [Gammaproteobacteria bacterium]